MTLEAWGLTVGPGRMLVQIQKKEIEAEVLIPNCYIDGCTNQTCVSGMLEVE
jgi:hypothetical protein